MDAVKTGTTIRLEEVRFGDDGEKAYYNVCFTEFHILPLPQQMLTQSAANMTTIGFSHLDGSARERIYLHQSTADWFDERARVILLTHSSESISTLHTQRNS